MKRLTIYLTESNERQNQDCLASTPIDSNVAIILPIAYIDRADAVVQAIRDLVDSFQDGAAPP